MIFKGDREKAEFAELVNERKGGALLLPLAAYFELLSRELFGVEPVVTGVFRTEAEQAEICRILGTPGARSVHEFWRGLDFRSGLYTVKQRDELVRRVNKSFRYRAGNGKLLEALAYHSQGTGAHLHAQAPDGTTWDRALS